MVRTGAADTGRPWWKDRWIPAIVALWLPILDIAVVIRSRHIQQKKS